MAFLKLGDHYLGVDPAPGSDQADPAAYPVHADRTAAGPWEAAELQPLPGGQFSVLFPATQRQLALTDVWALETRPAGHVGPGETFYATDQPDGAVLLYRVTGEGIVIPVLVTIDEPPGALPAARVHGRPALHGA